MAGDSAAFIAAALRLRLEPERSVPISVGKETFFAKDMP